VWRRSRRRSGRLAIAFACAAAVLVAVAASAGAFSEPYKALVSTSGDRSELTDHLDITSTPGFTDPARPAVVMSLPLSPVQANDRLKVSSELEVTTDCIDSAGHCSHYSDGVVGHPYDYNPVVDTQLVLASSPDATTGTPLTGLLEQRCRQQLPYRHHHCVPVFPSTSFDVPADPADPQYPACLSQAGGCYVNLVASAYNTHECDTFPGCPQRGDRLIVGEDEPDGSIVDDKGRVNAVRLRPNASGGTGTPSTASPLTTSLPIGNDSIANTVVFSQRLDNLKKNEQLEVAANLDTDIGQDQDPTAPNYLPYNVLIRSSLILTGSPTSTKISALAKDVSTSQGQITESNGFNCTHHAPTSESPWDSPCHTQKAGVIRMTADAKKLYVNLVVGTQAKRATPQPGDAVGIAPCSPGSCALQVVRYPASLKG
jgi:hypothetical protein